MEEECMRSGMLGGGRGRGGGVQEEHYTLREFAVVKLMRMMSERDTAVLERNRAVAELRAAEAERDQVMRQRDATRERRDAAVAERDAVLAALSAIRHQRGGGSAETASPFAWYRKSPPPTPQNPSSNPSWNPSLNPSLNHSPSLNPSLNHSPSLNPSLNHSPSLNPISGEKEGEGEGGDPPPKAKKKKKKKTEEEVAAAALQTKNMQPALVAPYCSCTGVKRQCYRWGNGGWQSSCCTVAFSAYPLPSNPKRKGYRLPGRKMSAGAFQKLCNRLMSEGGIDLKDYWGKLANNSKKQKTVSLSLAEAEYKAATAAVGEVLWL